jgi:hypothetical protein
MLTLFILKTSEGNRSVKETFRSLERIDHESMFVESIEEINNSDKKTDWYLVLHDNEYLSLDLKEAVKNILTMDISFDALIFLQKDTDGKFYQSPRLFKKHVRLKKNSLLPEDDSMKMVRILDGWINRHGI